MRSVGTILVITILLGLLAAVGWFAFAGITAPGEPMPKFCGGGGARSNGSQIVLEWTGVTIAELAGRALCLRYVLKDADVFTFPFQDRR